MTTQDDKPRTGEAPSAEGRLTADETLMAYADGELEPAERAQVEAAMAADPKVAARVDQHRALRKKLNSTFDRILLETVPNELVASVHKTPAVPSAATVTDLRRVRATRDAEAKEAAASARHSNSPRRPWTWFEWGAMAASVVAGAVIAHLALKVPGGSRIGTEAGQLVAQADLEEALSTQLASDQSADAPVQIGVSFRSKSGDTCRTFAVREQQALGGLACRQGNDWRVEVVADVPGDAAGAGAGGYKPASGNMPFAVLKAIEQEISGEPFDAAGEAAARAKGWH